MIVLTLLLTAALHSHPAKAQKAVPEPLINNEVIGRLTRYELKPGHQELHQALTDYVMYAMAKEGNIMAEAYYEQNDTAVLWLIERWTNRSELDKFCLGAQAKAIGVLGKQALAKKVETYYVKDLEPISKAAWRRTAKTDDRPLTIMLFVDGKAGTQENFKRTYHIAMPQFRGEPGVVTYQLSQVQGDDTRFVTYEKFRSEDAFQYHLAFPPIKPVLNYLETSIKKQPFQAGLHNLIEFAPLTRE